MHAPILSLPARVVEDDPWQCAMRRGDFAAAWSISDRILRQHDGTRRHSGPRHLQQIWDGTPLDGKRVLVRCYHGLGDTMQFARFLKPLRKIAREVILWAQPALLSLLSKIEGIDRLLPLHDGALDADYDIDIEIMELAHALRADERLIRQSFPYLPPPLPRPSPHAEPSIGLVWQAGDWNPRRSIPVERLGPLAEVPGIRLLSLQLGEAAGDACRIHAVDIASPSIEETARRMCGLDLIVTVDTFAAHLAGALGRRVLLLVHSQCDWRWMEHRARSVWYPTMRILRQRNAGDWSAPIDAARAHLQAISGRESPHGLREQTPLRAVRR